MKSTTYMTSKQKKNVLKDWKKFILNGFKYCYFTDELYQHIILHCSFIAHYNKQGFFSVYFESIEDTQKFLSQFDPQTNFLSVEMGLFSWRTLTDYLDINTAMCDAFVLNKERVFKNLKRGTLNGTCA